MEDSSAVDVDRNIPNALFTSVLGLKGPLRIAPHGSEHKPHIILKRVGPPGNLESNEETSRVARFSFFAHKRFEVKPGKEIMFAVASADGSEGPFKEIALVLEADLDATLDTANEERDDHSSVKKVDAAGLGNVQGLPPRMRKSYTKEKTYASYISKEPSSSLGFLGYPMNVVPNRVFSSASVQTDSPPPSSIEVSLVNVISQPAANPQSNKSPVQLPSPVSADHGRDSHPDNLAQLEEEDMDDISRIERSLSPMDLSSSSCSESPLHSPLPNKESIPEPSESHQSPIKFPVPTSLSPKLNSALPRFATNVVNSPEVKLVTTSTQVCETPEPPRETFQALNSSPLVEVSSIVSPHSPPPAILEAATTITISPQTSSSKPATTSTMTFEDSQFLRDTSKTLNPTLCEVSSAIASCKPRAMSKSTKSTISLSDLFVKATSSASGFSHTDTQVASSEVGNKILNGIVTPQRPLLNPTENAFASTSQVPLDDLRKVHPSVTLPLPPSRASIPNPSPPPDPKDVYIPAGSVGNPLGIRPSSNPSMTMAPNQRPLPSGPRSLRTATTVPTAKKPVVVGANWSAARSSGSSSSTNNSNPVTSSSSSSISASASTNSAVRPTSKVTDLSRILSYGSPSPPPPPASKPPLPPQCPNQSGASKWKRITGDDEKPSAISSDNSKTVTPLTLSTKTGQVSSSASLPNLPLKQAISFPSPKPSDNYLKIAHAMDLVFGTSSTAKPPAKPSPSISSDDKKQGDVDVEFLSSKKAKNGELASSSSSKNSAPAKAQFEAASALKASTSKPPQLLTHPLPPKPLPVHIGSSYRPSLKRERSRSPEVVPLKRQATSTDWPATYCTVERRLQVHESNDVGVQKVVFNHDGTQFALICADLTLRIWDNKQPPAEIASLQHTSSIVSVLWMENDKGVITLCQDGRISTWSRSDNKWIFTKIVTIPGPAVGDEPMCMVYKKNRIAVSIPTFGVRVWLCISGTWQPQREIIRSGVTAIRFVDDASALVGCCRDGVLWFCEVPNGTLRVHCFLSGKPISLDINPGGSHLLVGDEGGKARLVTLRTSENKGAVEQTYTSPKFQGKRQDFPSVFATKGQAILHGTLNGCALVWDKRKGTIVYGLKHPEDDPVQAAATFDGRPGAEGWMITGTKQGCLYWWPQPVAAASNHNDDSQRKRPKGG